ncbi:MAG TPA: hypothetical protein VHF00_01895, partial [Acidimicrobiales bacterium]|nr:hypothetical protein [Acidimicrobiales bacterium]
MADGVPPASGGDRIDVAPRPRGDDEGLKNAFAALLGLRGEEGDMAASAVSAVSLPPPRTAPDTAPPEPPPADDLWGPSDAPAPSGEWAIPEPLDEPPPSADDFWSSPDDEPSDRAWAPIDELGASPIVDVASATAAQDLPASADPSPPEVDEPRPPDLSLPARDRDMPPHVDVDRAEEPGAASSSLAGLQDVGLGGPLNTAMGDLRRLADDSLGRATPAPETRAGSLR